MQREINMFLITWQGGKTKYNDLKNSIINKTKASLHFDVKKHLQLYPSTTRDTIC